MAGEDATRFVDGVKAWLMWISLKPPVVAWLVEATGEGPRGCVQGSHCGAGWQRKGGRSPKSGLQVTRGKTCFLAAGNVAEMEGKERKVNEN